jgi:hypothetical protein
MSDLEQYGFDPESAADYNARVAADIGWLNRIPPRALKDEPLLGKPHDSEEFARGVHSLQKKFFPGQKNDQDGKLGRGTWGRILKTYDHVGDGRNYVVHNGRRLMLDGPMFKVINFDQAGGIDLHKHGFFYTGRGKKNYPVRYLVLHWGSTSGYRLAKVLTNRKISSHFGIDRDTIYQYLDTNHRAWHAGNVNHWSVGIDFCQQPKEEPWVRKLKKKGWVVDSMQNPTGRGHKVVCSLNAKAAHAGRQFVEGLCKALDIPFHIPRGKDGLGSSTDPIYHGVIPRDALKDGTFRGIVGHHHVTKQKWDIAPWWHQLFGDIY